MKAQSRWVHSNGSVCVITEESSFSCKGNQKVRPLKWKLSMSTFSWYFSCYYWREFIFLHFSTFVWIENDDESVKPIQTSPNERLLQTLWDFTDRDWQSWIQTRTATTFAFCWNPRFYLVSKQTFCCLSQETHRERARCGGNWESNVWRARADQTSRHRVHV